MLKVTCAIIRNNGKILICQRSEKMKLPLKWEFPGGKIEKNETKEQCLIREIKEELGLKITVAKELNTVEYHYPDFGLYLYPFICELEGGALNLSEHKDAIWVSIEKLTEYDWAEADIPIVNELMTLWN